MAAAFKSRYKSSGQSTTSVFSPGPSPAARGSFARVVTTLKPTQLGSDHLSPCDLAGSNIAGRGRGALGGSRFAELRCAFLRALMMSS